MVRCELRYLILEFEQYSVGEYTIFLQQRFALNILKFGFFYVAPLLSLDENERLSE
jgi:hypothetical protein